MESADELEQELTAQIAKEHQDFDTELQKLEQTVARKHSQIDNRINSIESNSNQLVGLVSRINSLGMKLSNLSESVNSFEDKLSKMEPVDRQEIDRLINRQVADKPKQINSQVSGEIKSFRGRLDATDSLSEIKSEMTDEPRIDAQALKLGKWYKAELQKKTERYTDEIEYLDDFRRYLRRFGITNFEDEEMAAAIHIALKAFPAVEIADPRIIKVWKLMCDNHLYDTTINVEMGWLGLQDWFPELFAEECFGRRLERVSWKLQSRNC